MTSISNKQVKLFNKILKEFVEEYSLITGSQLKIKAKSDKIIIFNTEVNNSLEEFVNCENTMLEKISILKNSQIDFDKINWEYLHTMYFISQGKSIDKTIVSRCKVNRSKIVTVIQSPSHPNSTGMDMGMMMNMIGNIGGMGDNQGTSNISNISSMLQSESFGKLVGDIAGQFAKTLEGKDLSNINPQDLLSGMMSGNMNIGGIDFQSILDTSTAQFKEKVESGEIDITEFTKQAHDTMDKLNLQTSLQEDVD